MPQLQPSSLHFKTLHIPLATPFLFNCVSHFFSAWQVLKNVHWKWSEVWSRSVQISTSEIFSQPFLSTNVRMNHSWLTNRLKGDRAETLAVQEILQFMRSKRGLNFPQDSATCPCRKPVIDSYFIRWRFGHFCHYYSVKRGKSSWMLSR